MFTGRMIIGGVVAVLGFACMVVMVTAPINSRVWVGVIGFGGLSLMSLGLWIFFRALHSDIRYERSVKA